MNTRQQEEKIKKVAKIVRELLISEHTGHDWWHILRVWNNARAIGKNEKVNMFIVELIALLHDLDDHKFKKEGESNEPLKAISILQNLQIEKSVVKEVIDIINNMGFRDGKNKDVKLNKEGQVVQDADRLDALGAIGIARTFATGAEFKHPLHNPESHIKKLKKLSQILQNKDKYEKTSINHFYEKLLLLKDFIHTKTAKKIAVNRHKYMVSFLKQFYAEWDGLK